MKFWLYKVFWSRVSQGEKLENSVNKKPIYIVTKYYETS